MSIYTQTHGPLSYHYVNNEIDAKQRQLARDRMALWIPHANPMSVFEPYGHSMASTTH